MSDDISNKGKKPQEKTYSLAIFPPKKEGDIGRILSYKSVTDSHRNGTVTTFACEFVRKNDMYIMKEDPLGITQFPRIKEIIGNPYKSPTDLLNAVDDILNS